MKSANLLHKWGLDYSLSHTTVSVWIIVTILSECNSDADCTYPNKNTCVLFKCSCNPGYFIDKDTCKPCKETQISTGGICKDCPLGKIPSDDKKQCESKFNKITTITKLTILFCLSKDWPLIKNANFFSLPCKTKTWVKKKKKSLKIGC